MQTIPINTDNSPPFILEILFRLKIKDAMTKEVITATKNESLRSIQQKMKQNGITGIPITEGKRLLGIVSVDDLLKALDNGYIHDSAEQWMSKNLTVLEDDMPLTFGISYFEKYRFGRFPIINKKREFVGIITSRDILISLLLELNKEAEKLEKQINIQSDFSTGKMRKEFILQRYNFEGAGKASTEIKKILSEKGIPRKTIRRIATAAFELEMNLVVHSKGGKIVFLCKDDRVEIIAKDTGPGIQNIEQAMQEGFSTANEWVRSLGFGAGMGLNNVKRVSDTFHITSSRENGTEAQASIELTNKSQNS